MADAARRKQKQRLKREEKRRQLQKQNHLSPFKKVELSSELVACYVNTDWRERGQATAFVLRELRDGSLAFCCFLVDSWCAGLKDCWAKFDVLGSEFDHHVQYMSKQLGNTIMRVPMEDIRCLFSAGIRFARKNGFKVPADWSRCASFLGTSLDIEHASLDGFGFEGNPDMLCWSAPMHDLRNRLIGTTAEEFLRRPNVKYFVEVGEDELAELDEMNEINAIAGNLTLDSVTDRQFDLLVQGAHKHAEAGAKNVAAWCLQNGRTPSTRLKDGVLLGMLVDSSPARSGQDSTNEPQHLAQAVQLAAAQYLEADLRNRELPAELREALIQYNLYMDSFPDANSALAGLSGFDPRRLKTLAGQVRGSP